MTRKADDDTRPPPKAIRRTPAEREALARLEGDTLDAGAAFWREHAPEEHKGLVDAEPVTERAKALGALFSVRMGVGDKAKAAWEWLKSSRVFRAVRTGVVIAATAVRPSVEAVADAGEVQAADLGRRLQDGSISLPEWQVGMEGVIRKAHAATGLVGGGGRHAITPAERRAVERRIVGQIEYLEAFAIDIENGLPLDNNIPPRSGLYGAAAYGTYEASRRVGDLGAGWSWERRILHSEVPCKSCTDYAAQGWQEALILPDIGEECECKSRCRCTFERSQTDPRPRAPKGKTSMRVKELEYLLTQPLLCTPEAAEVAASIIGREMIPEAVEARKGMKMDGETGMYRRNGVAVIPVHGPIFRHATMFTDLCGGATTAALARDLTLAREDQSISAILLDIDSPGGEAAGIGELAAMVRAANAVKPVCAYAGDQMCSAAYWIGAAAGEVVCSETASLGSIGVVMGMKVHADRPGVKSYEFVSTQSPEKRPDPATDTGRASIQKRCDDLASVFIAHVASYRGATPEAVQSDFGRGGVLTGKASVDAGMADAVGDFESTLARLSRGESLPKRPRTPPKPGKPAVANTPKGTAMALNPFKWLASLYESNPEAVQAAIDAEGDAVTANAGPFSRAADRYRAETFGTLKVDAKDVPSEDELRRRIEAEFAEKHAASVKANLVTFYGVQADAFLSSQVKAGTVTPADVPALKARYLDAALADQSAPLTFAGSDGQPVPVSRLTLLTDAVTKAPKSAWTEEKVKTPDDPGKGRRTLPTVASDDSETEGKVDPDRVKAMLGATDSGKAVLAKSGK